MVPPRILVRAAVTVYGPRGAATHEQTETLTMAQSVSECYRLCASVATLAFDAALRKAVDEKILDEKPKGGA